MCLLLIRLTYRYTLLDLSWIAKNFHENHARSKVDAMKVMLEAPASSRRFLRFFRYLSSNLLTRKSAIGNSSRGPPRSMTKNTALGFAPPRNPSLIDHHEPKSRPQHHRKLPHRLRLRRGVVPRQLTAVEHFHAAQPRRGTCCFESIRSETGPSDRASSRPARSILNGCRGPGQEGRRADADRSARQGRLDWGRQYHRDETD